MSRRLHSLFRRLALAGSLQVDLEWLAWDRLAWEAVALEVVAWEVLGVKEEQQEGHLPEPRRFVRPFWGRIVQDRLPLGLATRRKL